MTPWRIARAVTTSGITMFGLGLAIAQGALAEPTDAVVSPPGPSVEAGSDPVANDAAVTACTQFASAMDLAAINYSDFADATSGDQWNYSDPAVASANLTGRTALRQAAAATAQASGTEGLQPEIVGPMRSWSVHATKLLLIMGLRGSSGITDSAANQLNNDAHDVQAACAAAGTQA